MWFSPSAGPAPTNRSAGSVAALVFLARTARAEVVAADLRRSASRVVSDFVWCDDGCIGDLLGHPEHVIEGVCVPHVRADSRKPSKSEGSCVPGSLALQLALQ